VLGGLVKENVAHRLVTVACCALLTHDHSLADPLSGPSSKGKADSCRGGLELSASCGTTRIPALRSLLISCGSRHQVLNR